MFSEIINQAWGTYTSAYLFTPGGWLAPGRATLIRHKTRSIQMEGKSVRCAAFTWNAAGGK